VRVVDA